MSYTDKITYYSDDALFSGEPVRFDVDENQTSEKPFQESNPTYARAKDTFNQAGYMYPAPPIFMGQRELDTPQDDLYALRLLIKQPGSGFVLPGRMAYLQNLVEECVQYQQAHFPDYKDRFVYLTVRSGELKSVNEDDFHVDGFQGISVPRHIPEQNYVWADCHPTLFSMQPYFVEQLDPAEHNFHDYFNANTNREMAYSAEAKGLYIIDPYHVHARPNIPEGTQRSFLRICFSPVEIRDDTNTLNPWLPRGPYNREDIRNRLTEYREPANNPNCTASGLYYQQ